MYPMGGGQPWGQQGQGQGQGGYPQQQMPQQTGFMQAQPTGYQFQQRPPGMPQQQGLMGPQPTGMMMGGGPGPGLGGPGINRGMNAASPGMLGPGGSGQLNVPGGNPNSRFLSPGMGMQSQPTGMMMMSQPTGMMRPPQQQQQQQGSGFMGPQPTGFMGPQPTGFMGPQPTGFMGAQPTGMPLDPRMQLMSAQFLPGSTPFSGAPVASNMNFASSSMQPSNFQSQIQNLSQQQQGSREPKIPWALSKEERKSYDQIFRAWDQQGTGFISGDVAREVFGQSGIDRDSLMQIWHLSDTENRGKLNLAEFHVAMALIYRSLNGNDIPQELPPELVPPSSKQLNESVDFLKDLLKRDTNVRTSTGLNMPEAGSNRNASYGKSHSLYQNPVAPKQDATAYKHEDSRESGGYRSSSRHLDRKTVRYAGESKEDDLSEMKRQLANTQRLLDSHNDDDDDEDEREIQKEMDDLRFRIRRVQDDIDYYNRRGGRDGAEQRRKAERELMHLMHERLPQLEKRLEAKEKKRRDKRAVESKERDRRNQDYSRGSAYSSRYDDDDDDSRDYDSSRRDRGEYLRGSYERRGGNDSRDRSRDRYDDDRDRRRSGDRRDRDRDERPESPAQSRSAAAPPPPPVPDQPKAAPPPPAPPAAATAAPASGPPKNMSPEEKQAWIRSEAQRRIQERMRALGAAAPAAAATPDTSVEDRLKADRAEAEARAAEADKEAAAREEARKARLEEQKLAKDKAAISTVKSELAEQEKGKEAPPQPIIDAAKAQIDEEEQMLKRREEVLAKEKAERLARLKKLEEEEEEAKRQEEVFKQRQGMFKAAAATPPSTTSSLPPPSRKKGGPPPPPPTRARGGNAAPSAPAAPPAPPAVPAAAPEPPSAPPAPPVPASQSPTTGSTNPFHRMQGGAAPAGANGTPTTPGGTNPFFRGQASTDSSASSSLPAAARPAPPTAASASPAPKAPSAPRAPPTASDDDWGDSDKSDDDEDDDDGPGSHTRATRQNLAAALFSGMVPGGDSGRSTPTPAGKTASPATPTAPVASADSSGPPPPPAPPGPPAAPPAPPAAGAAPAAKAFSPPSGPADRGALLSAIQGGARLKKAQTRDASGPPGAGKVIGDASAPVQHYVPPPSPPSPPPAAPAPAEVPAEMTPQSDADDSFVNNPNRQSVDWANSLATEQVNGGPPKASIAPEEPSLREEEEESVDEPVAPEDPDGPSLAHRGLSTGAEDHAATEGYDLSQKLRVRALYSYSSQESSDLAFDENAIILAHPPLGGEGDWYLGTLLTGGSQRQGLLPRSYVSELKPAVTGRALYDFAGGSSGEATFSEGDELNIVDDEEDGWLRLEQDGSVKIAPASYVDLDVGTTKKDLSVSQDWEKVEFDDVRKQNAKSEPAAGKLTTEGDQTVLALSSSESEDSATGWTSSSEDEDDTDVEDQGQVDGEETEEARAAERMRVLVAAGLLVKNESSNPLEVATSARASTATTASNPDNNGQRRSSAAPPSGKGKRGPKPAAPVRRRTTRKIAKPERPLPPPPPPQPEEQMEDAYDRFVKLQEEMAAKRQSVLLSSPTPGSPGLPAELGGLGENVSKPGSPSPYSTGAQAESSSALPESRSSGLLQSLASSFRSKTATPSMERRVTPTISGPMSGGSSTMSKISVASPPGSASGPSTWSSFMDADLISSLPEQERKRQEAIFELCQTETTHVRDLQTIVEVFYNNIMQRDLLDEKAKLVIFGNIEDVLLTAVSFLSDLEERQRSSRLYVDQIGDIVARHLPNMKSYVPYCTNQATAATILKNQRNLNPALDQYLRELQAGPGRGLDLSSYLLTPMQRLTRYPLLLGQILKYTPEDHLDFAPIKRSNKVAENILAETNERIRDNESRERLRHLSQTLYIGDEARVDLMKPTRCQGDRKILKEEKLMKAKSKSGRKLVLILCNDLLLILDNNEHLYRMPSPLEEIVVRSINSKSGIRNEEASTSFQIIISGQDKINFKTNSARSAHLWMREIEEARSISLSAIMSSSTSKRFGGHQRQKLSSSSAFGFISNP
ncbi:unnamed protein product [Sympodiomycopsis kandeliae]